MWPHPACGIGRFGCFQLPSLLIISVEGVALGLAAGNPGNQTFPFTVGNLVFLGVPRAKRLLPGALLKVSLYLLSNTPPPPIPRLDFSLLWSGCGFSSLGDSALGSAGVMETPQPCPEGGENFFIARQTGISCQVPSCQRNQPPW